MIDELLAGQGAASAVRRDGLLGDLKKALLNQLMAAEFDHHLTQDGAAGKDKSHCNGSIHKRILTDHSQGKVTIARCPEPALIPC